VNGRTQHGNNDDTHNVEQRNQSDMRTRASAQARARAVCAPRPVVLLLSELPSPCSRGDAPADAHAAALATASLEPVTDAPNGAIPPAAMLPTSASRAARSCAAWARIVSSKEFGAAAASAVARLRLNADVVAMAVGGGIGVCDGGAVREPPKWRRAERPTERMEADGGRREARASSRTSSRMKRGRAKKARTECSRSKTRGNTCAWFEVEEFGKCEGHSRVIVVSVWCLARHRCSSKRRACSARE